MCKYMETKTVYANNYLFKIGDPDDSIYVVQSGRVHVYITDEVSFYSIITNFKIKNFCQGKTKASFFAKLHNYHH